jgi:hypothetical protein
MYINKYHKLLNIKKIIYFIKNYLQLFFIKLRLVDYIKII